MQNLEPLGWNKFFQTQYETIEKNVLPARVSAEYGEEYELFLDANTVRRGRLSGKMLHEAQSKLDLPATGDWVTIRSYEDGNAVITSLLTRKSQIIRQAAGRRTSPQVVGANVDIVWIVSSMNQEFNLRRIERYITMIWDSGASPVVVLNKSDLAPKKEEFLENAASVLIGVPIVAVSAKLSQGLSELNQYLQSGKTIALVGSSGVGKSTLVNWILGEEKQAVREIRTSDDEGQHTTTSRQLIVLPENKGLLLDTPGMRELQLWSQEEGLEQTFSDIEKLFSLCRYRNCQHQTEPGCGVLEALEKNTLDEGRWKSYQKLQREKAFQTRKMDENSVHLERARYRQLGKMYRRIQKEKGNRR